MILVSVRNCYTLLFQSLIDVVSSGVQTMVLYRIVRDDQAKDVIDDDDECRPLEQQVLVVAQLLCDPFVLDADGKGGEVRKDARFAQCVSKINNLCDQANKLNADIDEVRRASQKLQEHPADGGEQCDKADAAESDAGESDLDGLDDIDDQLD